MMPMISYRAVPETASDPTIALIDRVETDGQYNCVADGLRRTHEGPVGGERMMATVCAHTGELVVTFGGAKERDQIMTKSTETTQARALYEATRKAQWVWHNLADKVDEDEFEQAMGMDVTVPKALTEVMRQRFIAARDAYSAHGEATNEWVSEGDEDEDTLMSGLPPLGDDGKPIKTLQEKLLDGSSRLLT